MNLTDANMTAVVEWITTGAQEYFLIWLLLVVMVGIYYGAKAGIRAATDDG